MTLSTHDASVGGGIRVASIRSVAPPVTVLVSCAFCVRARHACMFGVRVRR